MAKLTKEQNNALFERISAIRKKDPKRYASIRIGAKWDALNSHYENKGIDDEFVSKFVILKETIYHFSGVITLEEVTNGHPDEYAVTNKKTGARKFIHGYNFNYK